MLILASRQTLQRLAIPVGLAPLLLAASLGSGVARAGEIKGASGLQSLGSVINGIRNGSCTAGHCSITGGTGAGSNLFHRFEKFDTRGAISGASINNDSFSNVIVGVIDPAGSFINKMVALSSKGNLFWLSPGGISLTAGGGFTNVATLQLSTATTLAVGSGFFDVYGSTASQVAGLRGIPIPGSPGLSTDPASLSAIGLSANGDLTIDDGLLTVDHSLLLDSQGGHLLLNASSLSADGGTIALAGRSVSLESSSLDVSNDIGSGGLVSIDAADIVIASSSINASGATAGGSISIAATGSVNLSDSDLTAIGGDGSGGEGSSGGQPAGGAAPDTAEPLVANPAQATENDALAVEPTAATTTGGGDPAAAERAEIPQPAADAQTQPETNPGAADSAQLSSAAAAASADAADGMGLTAEAGHNPGSGTGSAAAPATAAPPATASAPGGSIAIAAADITISGGRLDASGATAGTSSTGSGAVRTDTTTAGSWSRSLQSTGLVSQMDQALSQQDARPAVPDPAAAEPLTADTLVGGDAMPAAPSQQQTASPAPDAPVTATATAASSDPATPPAAQPAGSDETTTTTTAAAAAPTPAAAMAAPQPLPGGGDITLQAADTLTLTGATLTASGSGPQARGGSILLEADAIALAASSIDASGTTGGGHIQIGGGRRGEDTSIRNASTLTASADTTISVEATTAGDGGELILYASDVASIDAQLSATGGADSGDGGFIETSAGLLSVTQAPDTSAANGNAGTWLIDPYDIIIADRVNSNVRTGVDGNGNQVVNATASPSLISAAELSRSLDAGGRVVIDTIGSGLQSGDIIISAPIVTSSGQDGADLVFIADGLIHLDADIRSTGSPLQVAFTTNADNSPRGPAGLRWGDAVLDLRGGEARVFNGLTAEPSGDVRIWAGQAAVASGTTVKAASTELLKASLRVDGEYANSGTFVAEAATIGGEGLIRLNGPTAFSDLVLEGVATIDVDGPLSISGTNRLDGVQLSHADRSGGSVMASGASLTLDGNALFRIEPGAELIAEVAESQITTIRHERGSRGRVLVHGTLQKRGAGDLLLGDLHELEVVIKEGTISIHSGPVTIGSGTRFTQAGRVELIGAAARLVSGGFTNSGTIVGTGRLDLQGGTLLNHGVLSPGPPRRVETGAIGTLSLRGHYVQSPSGTLQLDLGGTSEGASDRVVVGGHATLSGELSVSLAKGYQPQEGDQFVVLNSGGGVRGEWSSQSLPAGLSSQLRPQAAPRSLVLLVAPENGSPPTPSPPSPVPPPAPLAGMTQRPPQEGDSPGGPAQPPLPPSPGFGRPDLVDGAGSGVDGGSTQPTRESDNRSSPTPGGRLPRRTMNAADRSGGPRFRPAGRDERPSGPVPQQPPRSKPQGVGEAVTRGALAETQSRPRSLNRPTADPGTPPGPRVAARRTAVERPVAPPLSLQLGTSELALAEPELDPQATQSQPGRAAPAPSSTRSGASAETAEPQSDPSPERDASQTREGPEDRKTAAVSRWPSPTVLETLTVQVLSSMQATASFSESERRSRALMVELLNLAPSSAGSRPVGPEEVPAPDALQRTLINAMQLVRQRIHALHR
ncbi:hypothetical protein EVJ50_13005 [Synechococcus sp. RSCCF101]|uniref:hypothetical protein n=1 Tax=Synechococcus sp. RSCCF101 TaxID=2511069 RepID=UPI0012491C04|nr:hypothetical protein [Synechococcus sp. RSCCF101]QEY33007.1 hypothetical protein EVJ50_13005 [Synechococcus sp. RSCCF101]